MKLATYTVPSLICCNDCSVAAHLPLPTSTYLFLPPSSFIPSFWARSRCRGKQQTKKFRQLGIETRKSGGPASRLDARHKFLDSAAGDRWQRRGEAHCLLTFTCLRLCLKSFGGGSMRRTVDGRALYAHCFFLQTFVFQQHGHRFAEMATQ